MNLPRVQSVIFVLFPILVLGAAVTFWVDQNYSFYENYPLHSVVKLIAASIALIVFFGLSEGHSYVILKSSETMLFSAALVALGLLDIFHAIESSGSSFDWLESFGTAVAGVLFALLWLPLTLVKIPRFVVGATSVGILIVVSAMLLKPDHFPQLIVYDAHSSVSIALNLIGATGFLMAAFYFLRQFFVSRNSQYVLLFLFSFLLAGSGFLYLIDMPWSPIWWGKQLLELLALLVLAAFFLHSFRGVLLTPFNTLRGKVILLSAGISVAVAVLVSGLNYIQTTQKTLDATIESLSVKAHLMALRFQNAYDAVQNDVRIIANTPPITGLIRSLENGGVDPTDGSTTALWKDRLATIFSSVMRENPHYMRIRYIGLSENGRELVKVSRARFGFRVVPDVELREKAKENYVKTVQEGRDTFFFTKVTLNKESEAPDGRSVPTIRAVMPVKNSSDELYGLVIINVDFESLMQRMFRHAKPTQSAFLINQSGDYVEYDPKTGSVHLEYHERFTKEQPDFVKTIVASRQDQAVLEDAQNLTLYSRMQIDKSTTSEFVGAIIRVPRDEVLQNVVEVRRESIYLAVILAVLSVLVALLVSRKITGPLERMTENINGIKDYADPLELPVKLNDEIGALARAFSELTRGILDSERQATAVMDTALDGVIIISEDGTIERYNPGAERIFGYSPEEVIGRKINMLMPEPHSGDHDHYLKNYILTGLKKIIGSGREVEGRRKNGTVFPMSLSVNELVQDGRRSFTGVVRDISDRVAAEEQLRLLQMVIDYSRDVVTVTTANPENPEIIYINKASKEVCGYEPHEMIGMTPRILQGIKTDRSRLDELKAALRSNRAFNTELINYAKDGREYWVDVSIFPVNDGQGNTTHFASISRDITDKVNSQKENERLIEDLRRSNRELDNFAYVASHDLKAPLRVIDNASHWLEEDLEQYLDEDTRESFDLLRSRVKRMERLLDDLLEYSRIGRKEDAGYSQIVSGGELVRELSLLINAPQEFAITFSDAFSVIELPRMPLQQVLLNLINNGIKHHDRSDGKINLDVIDQGNFLLFTVEDDGPGIAEKYQEQVFKMFQTLKPRDQVEGSGMGLAIVKKHIELLGGSITLSSEEGHGCKFQFTWPKSQQLTSERGIAYG
ncbi:PAS domain S-box protein [Sneathiella glossodoripedis]|uniref:PAS domain S-box protein n=1 Tax=Sneathiella glossodoripedis TaxID=418853 RepID=UPI0004702867|nr:PAS domain S-box protein [Sneathiella glossodoripedis]